MLSDVSPFTSLMPGGMSMPSSALPVSVMSGASPILGLGTTVLSMPPDVREQPMTSRSFQSLEGEGAPDLLPFEDPFDMPAEGPGEHEITYACVVNWITLAGEKGYATMADLDFGLSEGPGKTALLRNFKSFASQQNDGNWGIGSGTISALMGATQEGVALAGLGERYRREHAAAMPPEGAGEKTVVQFCLYQWSLVAGSKRYLTLADIEFGLPDGAGKSALLRNFASFSKRQGDGVRGISSAEVGMLNNGLLLGKDLDALGQEARIQRGDNSLSPQLKETLLVLRDGLLDLVDGSGYVSLSQLPRRVPEQSLRQAIRGCFESLGLVRMGPVEINQAILSQTLADEYRRLTERWSSFDPEEPSLNDRSDRMDSGGSKTDMRDFRRQIGYLEELMGLTADLQPPAKLTFGEALVVGAAMRAMADLVGAATSLEEQTRRMAMRLFGQMLTQVREPFWSGL